MQHRSDNRRCPALLIVEHETPLRLDLALRLGAAYSVAAVATPGEALQLVALGASFDLVLCEAAMPEMNGVQLCERLAEIDARLAAGAVLISDGVVDDDLRRALAVTPNPCIKRPFATDELARVLEEHRERADRAEASGRLPVPAAQEQQLDAASVFSLAVRLIRGEVFDLVDPHGRSWRASATTLDLVGHRQAGSSPVVVGYAADIALEVIRRGLRASASSDAPARARR